MFFGTLLIIWHKKIFLIEKNKKYVICYGLGFFIALPTPAKARLACSGSWRVRAGQAAVVGRNRDCKVGQSHQPYRRSRCSSTSRARHPCQPLSPYAATATFAAAGLRRRENGTMLFAVTGWAWIWEGSSPKCAASLALQGGEDVKAW